MKPNTAPLRRALALLLAATPALLVGCATTGTPMASDAHAVYCVSADRECNREAVEACPYGYKTLSKESWSSGPRDVVTDQIIGTESTYTPNPAQASFNTTARTQHTKLIVECSPST